MNIAKFVKWHNDDLPGDRVRVQGNIHIYRRYVVPNMPINVEVAKDHILDDLQSIVDSLSLTRKDREDIYMKGYRDALAGFEPNPPKED